jgi:hypothetical protein
VAAINTEIVEGVTKELAPHLEAFYLGVTNEWLEAMALAIGDKQTAKSPGDRECFPLERGKIIGFFQNLIYLYI